MEKKKWIAKEYVVPFLIMLAITGAGIAAFMLTIGLGADIAPSIQVEEEVTKPTIGRLTYVILSFIAFIVTAILAEKKAKADKVFPAFYLGFVSGMLLWQCLGEGFWHFGYSSPEGYSNFFRIESPGSLGIVIVFAIFTGYLMKKGALGFGVLCTILSFLCNWYGHFISEGTYPYVSGIIERGTWYAISGVSVGLVLVIVSIILPIKKFKDTRGHLLCSMLLYIGISVISFGFIE